jgi:hypothetical protein
MKTKSIIEILALALGLSAAPFATAHAHFKLLAPDSWLNENDVGAPQKMGPCGPGGDDDVQPVPMSMKVTTVHAGDTIEIKIQETVHHPGWFRIALDSNRDNFKDPDFPNADCTVDMSKVPTGAHENVLADGLEMDTNVAGANRMLTEKVVIPNTPCEKCTLQVIQVMADAIHRPPGCVYHHCADLKIVAADSSSAAGASATAGASASTAGSSANAGASGSGGATASDNAGKGGSSIGTAGSSSTTTATAGKSGSTSGTTTSGQTGAAGQRGDLSHHPVCTAGSTAAPCGGTTGAASTTPAAAPASSSGGCSVTHVSSTSNGLLAFGIGAFIAGAFARRTKKRSSRRRLAS